MNAPTTTRPSRERYIPIVKHHCPGSEGRELSLRCSILQMRDQASSNARHCSDEAYVVLTEVSRIATQYAFCAMPVEELADLRHRLLQLTIAASGLNQFAHRLAYPNGEADAGG